MFKDRSTLQNRIISTLVAALLVGTLVLVALLMQQSAVIRDSNDNAVVSVQLGPLELINLVKTPVEGGSTIEMSAGAGLAWYVIFWVGLGCAVGYLRWRLRRGAENSL